MSSIDYRRQSVGFRSPYQVLYKRRPTVSHFRVFGCVCYVFVPEQLRTKLEKKAIRCIFVGYDEQKKGWRCVDPTTKKAYISRHVVFDDASSWWSTEKVVLPDTEFLDTTMRALFPEQEEIPVASDSRPVESPRSSSRTDSSLSPWKTGVRESGSPRLATPEVSSLRDSVASSSKREREDGQSQRQPLTEDARAAEQL